MRIKSCSFQPARVLSVLVHASRLKLKRGHSRYADVIFFGQSINFYFDWLFFACLSIYLLDSIKCRLKMATRVDPDVRKRIVRGLTVSNVLATSWVVLLWWGESYTFKSAVSRCRWHKWEKWVPSCRACRF